MQKICGHRCKCHSSYVTRHTSHVTLQISCISSSASASSAKYDGRRMTHDVTPIMCHTSHTTRHTHHITHPAWHLLMPDARMQIKKPLHARQHAGQVRHCGCDHGGSDGGGGVQGVVSNGVGGVDGVILHLASMILTCFFIITTATSVTPIVLITAARFLPGPPLPFLLTAFSFSFFADCWLLEASAGSSSVASYESPFHFFVFYQLSVSPPSLTSPLQGQLGFQRAHNHRATQCRVSSAASNTLIYNRFTVSFMCVWQVCCASRHFLTLTLPSICTSATPPPPLLPMLK
jgi:hypothetical protein